MFTVEVKRCDKFYDIPWANRYALVTLTQLATECSKEWSTVIKIDTSLDGVYSAHLNSMRMFIANQDIRLAIIKQYRDRYTLDRFNRIVAFKWNSFEDYESILREATIFVLKNTTAIEAAIDKIKVKG